MKTALQEYQRLEASGLWRKPGDKHRIEVIVSLGEATLTISDTRDNVLAHWSIAAVDRANKGQRPALYHPYGDEKEQLELGDDAVEMIEAIERLRRVIERRRPKPGRLRIWGALGFAIAVTSLSVFWLPDALVRHTLNVLPDVQRGQIGQDMLDHIARLSGQPCRSAETDGPLRRLSQRLTGAPERLIVLGAGTARTAHLPGGLILVNRSLLEDWEDPAVVAGHVLAETLRQSAHDPMLPVLQQAGLLSSLRLLTTGTLPQDDLRAHAETVMVQKSAPVPTDDLLRAFEAARISSRPYAFALDVTGERTLDLIEGDPARTQPADDVLSDGDWVRLQGICGN